MRKALVFLFILFLPLSAHAATCSASHIDVLNDGTNCQTSKFELTTTTDTTSLIFAITATGVFYVDCGDGGLLTQDTSTYGTISGKTVTRTSGNKTVYTCSWNSAAAHTIKFAGTATGYSVNASTTISFYQDSGGTQNKIASINGSLGAMFPVIDNTAPRFNSTFRGCSNMTNIPVTLFAGIDTTNVSVTNGMFAITFYGCTSLTTIPENLFSSIDTRSATDTRYMFYDTFANCTGLTGNIPAGLFSSINTRYATRTSMMFSDTFANCTGLTGNIPADLFSGIDTRSAIDTVNMFAFTFYNCARLTGGIPSGLFRGIDTHSAIDTTQMFYATFNSCYDLTGYISSTAFQNTIVSGSSANTNMWAGIFDNSGLATSCDSFNLTQYITGFESYWNGKISCGCGAGKQLNKSTNSCESCPNGSYSDGSAMFLDPNIVGTSYTDSPIYDGSGTWTTTFSYGVVSGISTCNSVSANYGIAYNEYDFEPEVSGTNCWCKMTNPSPSGWVLVTSSTNTYNCGTYCVNTCGENRADSSIRKALYDSVACQQCTNAPLNAHYTGAGTTSTNCPWECDAGYGRTKNDTCEPLCSAGITKLKTSTGLSFNVYAAKTTTPSINIKPDNTNTVCYVNLAIGNATNTINVQYGNTVYHTTN